VQRKPSFRGKGDGFRAAQLYPAYREIFRKYKIHACDYEAIYSGMPPFGLGHTGAQVVVIEANDGARQRLG
jgi:hypothetical protein